MTREEALKIVRENYPHFGTTEPWLDLEKALATLVPELRESEDERIRKWIASYIHHGVFTEDEHPMALKAVEWLEKQKEQKPVEWSEEDESKLGVIIRLVEQNSGWPYRVIKKYVNWLKFLRPHWKPSEQEKGALRTAIHILTDERSFPKAAAHLQNILDAFEGKESRKYWKPSNEQMGALYYSIEWKEERAEDVDFILKSLYNDLKKLM